MSPCGVTVKRLPTDKYGLSLTRACAQVTSTRPTCKLHVAGTQAGGSRYATRAFATPIFVASATPIFVASATPYFRISATQTAATPKILF